MQGFFSETLQMWSQLYYGVISNSAILYLGLEMRYKLRSYLHFWNFLELSLLQIKWELIISRVSSSFSLIFLGYSRTFGTLCIGLEVNTILSPLLLYLITQLSTLLILTQLQLQKSPDLTPSQLPLHATQSSRYLQRTRELQRHSRRECR